MEDLLSAIYELRWTKEAADSHIAINPALSTVGIKLPYRENLQLFVADDMRSLKSSYRSYIQGITERNINASTGMINKRNRSGFPAFR